MILLFKSGIKPPLQNLYAIRNLLWNKPILNLGLSIFQIIEGQVQMQKEAPKEKAKMLNRKKIIKLLVTV